jgi:hypothetical protein
MKLTNLGEKQLAYEEINYLRISKQLSRRVTSLGESNSGEIYLTNPASN